MKKPVSTIFIMANENVVAFTLTQIVAIQKYTIRQIFKKAFPKHDFKDTKFIMQGKWE